MNRKLYTILLAAAAAFAVPVVADAMTAEAQVASNIDEREVKITVVHNAATIEGAAGKTLEVTSLTGRPVMKVRVDNDVQRVELNLPKGCYILKVDKVVRKVSVS